MRSFTSAAAVAALLVAGCQQPAANPSEETQTLGGIKLGCQDPRVDKDVELEDFTLETVDSSQVTGLPYGHTNCAGEWDPRFVVAFTHTQTSDAGARRTVARVSPEDRPATAFDCGNTIVTATLYDVPRNAIQFGIGPIAVRTETKQGTWGLDAQGIHRCSAVIEFDDAGQYDSVRVAARVDGWRGEDLHKTPLNVSVTGQRRQN